jgi:hypothetical protein
MNVISIKLMYMDLEVRWLTFFSESRFMQEIIWMNSYSWMWSRKLKLKWRRFLNNVYKKIIMTGIQICRRLKNSFVKYIIRLIAKFKNKYRILNMLQLNKKLTIMMEILIMMNFMNMILRIRMEMKLEWLPKIKEKIIMKFLIYIKKNF